MDFKFPMWWDTGHHANSFVCGGPALIAAFVEWSPHFSLDVTIFETF